MANKIIRLFYRKMIDSTSRDAWGKSVFEDTYTEFLMQSQFYNQHKKYHIFGKLIANVPSAEKLHFLVSSAAIGYLKQLNGKIPDVLNVREKHFLSFTNYRFEIIHSDTKNKAVHQVAINFYSEPLIWHETIGNYLLVSPKDQAAGEDRVLTDLFQLQPFLTIYSFKTES